MEPIKQNLTKAERKAFKAKNKLQKQIAKAEKKQDIINILCVRFGNKYNQDYVIKLRNMVSRHCSLPYKFYCLTDDPKPINGVRSIVKPNMGYIKGWWHKVHMFDPSLGLSGRILYMDLDVIICKSIDKLCLAHRDEFVGIRDFNRKFHPSWHRLNSSVMAWNGGTQTHIFRQFQENPKVAMRMHGDQDWIWKTSSSKLKFWPDEWVQSYKWEIRSKNELMLDQGKRKFKEVKNDIRIHDECSIAVFHGDPNPSHVQDKFVLDNWK